MVDCYKGAYSGYKNTPNSIKTAVWFSDTKVLKLNSGPAIHLSTNIDLRAKIFQTLTVHFCRTCVHCSLRFLIVLKEVEPDVVYFFCSSCPRVVQWSCDWLQPFCQVQPVRLLSPDLSYQRNLSVCRTSAHWMILVFINSCIAHAKIQEICIYFMHVHK